MKNPIEMIAEERQRQISEEGYSELHDDNHDEGSLAMAAACYAAPEPIYNKKLNDQFHVTDAWPWGRLDDCDKRWKHNRMRQLTIAGALIVAEMERLKRAVR